MGHILAGHPVFSHSVDVAILGWTSESAGVAEFVALLPFEGTVPACQVAGVVVHSDHGLIIPVSVRHSGNEVVLIRSDVNVGHGEQIDQGSTDGADVVGGNHIARECCASSCSRDSW